MAETRSKLYPGIYSRDDGKTWAYRAQFQDAGGRWGVHGSGYGTQKEARDARGKAIEDAEAQRGREHRLDPSISVGDYLAVWLPAHAGTLRPSTVACYESVVGALQRTTFARLQLRTLTDSDVRRLVGELRTTAPSMAHATLMLRLRVLRTALSAAVRDGVLRANPATGVKVPRTAPRFEAQVWDAPTALAFLRHRRSAGDPLYPIWRLALMTGLRRGEILGLQWSDVDLAAGQLQVRRQRGMVKGRAVETAPKTEGSSRSVALDADTCALLSAMPRRSLYVAHDVAGRPWHPLVFTRQFGRAMLDAGVPVIRFHDLRHTSATLLASAGVAMNVAQARLGHMSPEMTARYTHIQNDAARAAATSLAAVLRDDDGDGSLVAVS